MLCFNKSCIDLSQITHLEETLIWCVVFFISGVSFVNVWMVILTCAFASLLSVTMPMSWVDIRQELLDETGASELPFGRKSINRKEEIRSPLVQTLMLLVAILVGAVFTEKGPELGLLVWPLPAFLSFSVVRIVTVLVVRV